MNTQVPTDSVKIKLLKWFVFGFGALLLFATFIMFAVAAVMHKKGDAPALKVSGDAYQLSVNIPPRTRVAESHVTGDGLLVLHLKEAASRKQTIKVIDLTTGKEKGVVELNFDTPQPEQDN